MSAMDSGVKKFVVVIVMVTMGQLVKFGDCNCTFNAIFNFGDSNTDTGTMSIPSPNGVTYFKQPAGRTCDGRLIIDFLAQALGFPFLNPYLKSGSDYSHGVNFATQASTVLKPDGAAMSAGISQYSLDVQLSQMKSFKSSVDSGANNIPSDIFAKSLYTIYIGQNDVTGVLGSKGAGGVKDNLPQVVNDIVKTVKELYGLGARTFMVLNVGPIGCYPSFLVQFSHSDSDLDNSGCMTLYNNAVSEYNQMLKNALFQTKSEISNANIVYVDTYSALLDVFQNPSSHGLKYSTRACCGAGGGSYNYDPKVFCGHTGSTVNGSTVTASACEDPYNYVSWDGVHNSEATNKIVAQAIVNGYYTYPKFDLHQVCDIQSIG